MDFQQTLAAAVEVRGIGLHSGQPVVVRLLPADVGVGLVFRRVDLGVEVVTSPFAAAHTPLQTKLVGETGLEVQTPEHLLAALAGLGVDNCVIEIDSAEVPILDGSALPWVEAIDTAGRVQQDALRVVHVIKSAIHVDLEGRILSAVPDARAGLRLGIVTDFPVLGRGELAAKVNEDFFRREIAPARTFCFEKDVAAMQAAGLALGGSLENAVVFRENGSVANPEGLRFPDEPLRHKFLDAVGDLYLGGALQGKLSLTAPGHTANNVLLREIFARGLEA